MRASGDKGNLVKGVAAALPDACEPYNFAGFGFPDFSGPLPPVALDLREPPAG
jgi:hypothetical protein